VSQKVSNWAKQMLQELDKILEQPKGLERDRALEAWRVKLAKVGKP
jgi:hypothetical protein